MLPPTSCHQIGKAFLGFERKSTKEPTCWNNSEENKSLGLRARKISSSTIVEKHNEIQCDFCIIITFILIFHFLAQRDRCMDLKSVSFFKALILQGHTRLMKRNFKLKQLPTNDKKDPRESYKQLPNTL